MTATLPVPATGPPPTTGTTPANTRPPSLFDRAVLLSVDISKLGNRKKVPTGAITVDADKDLLAVSKTLIDAEEFQAITKIDGEIRQMLYAHALPSSFKSGVYLMPIDLLADVDAKLQEFAIRRDRAVATLVACYPALVRLAAERLRVLFRQEDYPTADRVRAAFSLSWNYIQIGVPTTLARIDKQLFEREREKAAVTWQEATDEVRATLREGLAELVEHMVTCLSPRDDGKPRKFHDSAVSNFREFLTLFEARNITDDQELSQLAARARSLLNPALTPQMIRERPAVRESLRKAMDEIKENLETLITERPARKIDFGGDQ